MAENEGALSGKGIVLQEQYDPEMEKPDEKNFGQEDFLEVDKEQNEEEHDLEVDRSDNQKKEEILATRGDFENSDDFVRASSFDVISESSGHDSNDIDISGIGISSNNDSLM